MMSSPPRPQITSAPEVPTSVSSPGVPVIVHLNGDVIGCQTGASPRKPLVRRPMMLPFARITQMSMLPLDARLLSNVISFPSGDHDGSTSSDGMFVRFVCPD